MSIEFAKKSPVTAPYRELNSFEIEALEEMKEGFAELINAVRSKRDISLSSLESTGEDGLMNAEMYSIAIQKLEEACMWAEKALTS